MMSPSTRTVLCAAVGTIVFATTAPADVTLFPRPFHIIAHRGASAYAPENTIPACRKALELGAVEVEVDVQLSGDKQVVLFHDDTLTKKTGRSGRVSHYTLADLQQMQVGRWFHESHPDVEEDYRGTRLDSLAELFDQLGRQLSYHVEFKSRDPDLPAQVIELVRAAGLEDHVVLSSFHFEQLVRAREVTPQAPLTYLVPKAADLRRDGEAPLSGATLLERQRQEIARAHGAGISMVGIASRDLSPEIVSHAHSRGLTIRAWKITSDEDMERAILLGTNGMTTNWPERLIRRQLEYLSGRPFERSIRRPPGGSAAGGSIP